LEAESTFTYDLEQALIQAASSGNPIRFTAYNTSTGDAQFTVIAGAQTYSWGVDNSASDVFDLVVGETLGSGSIFSVGATGDFLLKRQLDMTSNSIKGVIGIDLTGDITGNGTANLFDFDNISANSKSFDIEHPTKKLPWRIEYGVLEGPEHGVFFRGQTTENVIELPDYWVDLVHEDSYTVHLTPIGGPCVHWVEKVENNKVYINCQDGKPNCYFTINATRKDVNPPKLEYIKK
jgi:hypothetical protein